MIKPCRVSLPATRTSALAVTGVTARAGQSGPGV